MLYIFCLTGAWLIWHFFYRFRVVGRKNLPRKGGYVMICNHLAATDPVYVLLSRFWGRKMLVLAKDELFHKLPILTWYLKKMGGVPISRGKADTKALDEAVEKVRAGRSLLVFPEGTRSKTGQLQPLKSGAFVVAASAGVPIVPCRIIYQDGKPHFWHKVTVVIGSPLSLQELGLAPQEETPERKLPPPAALRSAKARCVQVMEELLEDNKDRAL